VEFGRILMVRLGILEEQIAGSNTPEVGPILA